MSVSKPFPRSYWVVPEKILAGQFPGDADDDKRRERIEALFNCGVRTIINLQEESEIEHDPLLLKEYRSLFESAGKVNNAEVKFHRISIKDFSTPSTETMKQILDTVDAEVAAGHTLYIHCWGGIGRTGMVVGCFLKRHGMAGDDVLDKIAQLRHDDAAKERKSPETPEQEAFVINWLKGM